MADAGHEVACHGELHLRANDRPPAEFRADVTGAKARLEDLIGAEVVGFRAPEWSLRSAANPRLRVVAEAGFRYDSSLMPAWGAGDSANPTEPTLFSWPDGRKLIELPPRFGIGIRGGGAQNYAPPLTVVSACPSRRRAGAARVFVVARAMTPGRGPVGQVQARTSHERTSAGGVVR